MADNTGILVRNARDQDLSDVAEMDAEAFSPYETAENPETFQFRLMAFPNGFIILVADNEIAAYGCSEKWLTERMPALDEDPRVTHQPDGKIFCITGLAVRLKYRGRGFGLLVLNKLIETAHLEGCKKIILGITHAEGFFLQQGLKSVNTRTERGKCLTIMSLDIISYGRE